MDGNVGLWDGSEGEDEAGGVVPVVHYGFLEKSQVWHICTAVDRALHSYCVVTSCSGNYYLVAVLHEGSAEVWGGDALESAVGSVEGGRLYRPRCEAMQPRISFGNAMSGNVDGFMLAMFMGCGE